MTINDLGVRPDEMAFWNRWTLGLDFGPGNAGLWTEISGNLGPKTHKIGCIHVLILDLTQRKKGTKTVPLGNFCYKWYPFFEGALFFL